MIKRLPSYLWFFIATALFCASVISAQAPRLHPSNSERSDKFVSPELNLTKTVGTDPNTCAVDDTIEVAVGDKVYYCFDMENTTGVTLDTLTLADSEVGTILDEFPFMLAAGASVFVTAEHTVYSDVVNTATWTAEDTDTGTFYHGVDSATVTTHPAASLTKTVGTDPQICSSTNEITVAQGTNVYFCYRIENLSDSTFAIHDLEDSELGPILDEFPHMLTAGASVFVTAEYTANFSVINTATWTLYKEGTMEAFDAIDSATVHVIGNTPTPTPTASVTPTSTPTPTASPLPPADLSVEIEGAPDPVNVGGSLVYTIRVANQGPGAASDAQVTVYLPESVDFVSASGGCTASNGRVECGLGSMAAMTERALMVVVGTIDATNVCALAQVHSTETDPDPLNNSAVSFVIGVSPPPMTFHPADINENLSIGPDDLLELLEAWKLELK